MHYWKDCDKRILGITNAPVKLIEVFSPKSEGKQPSLAFWASDFEPFSGVFRQTFDARKEDEEREVVQKSISTPINAAYLTRAYPDVPETGPEFASSQAVERVFGTNFKVLTFCDEAGSRKISAEVYTVNLPSGSEDFARAAKELLRRSLRVGWLRECTGKNTDAFAVRVASIYSRGEELFRADGLRQTGRQGLFNPLGPNPVNVSYVWQNFHNIAEERRREAEQRRLKAEAEANAIWWEKFWETAKVVVLFLLAAIVFGFLLWHWQTFARWYFFLFYPHPARHMARQALNTRTVPNGRAFAAAIGEMPAGGAVFRKVRFEQGEELIAQMQALSRSIATEQERRLAAQDARNAARNERDAVEAYERAALIDIQEAVALAAAALERAKATWRSSEALRARRV
jgi:hypothetical protein